MKKNETDGEHSSFNIKHPEVVEKKLEKVSAEISFDWELSGPEYKLWPEDSNCSNLVTRFVRPKSLPIRALASYPGSGNTWIRYLIEGASGIYTGSVLQDGALYKAGYFGEMRNFADGSTLLQKTHHRFGSAPGGIKWRIDDIAKFHGRGVVVVRNPFKALLSWWNFKNTQSHTEITSSDTFATQKFRNHVKDGVEKWLEIIYDWLEYSIEVYFIFYEDLKEAPTKEIRQLMNYLKVPVDEARLNCIDKHLTGSFKRKNYKVENPFVAEDHQMIRDAIDHASKIMKKKTGRDLPIHKYEFYKI